MEWRVAQTAALLWALLAAQAGEGAWRAVSSSRMLLPGGGAKRGGPWARVGLHATAATLGALLLWHVGTGGGEVALEAVVRVPLIDAGRDPNLKECGNTLNRLQIALVVELSLEVVIWFLVCCCRSGMCYKETKGIAILRALYAVPVIVVNAGLLWFGSQGGSCLRVEEVRIAFAELILYAVLSVLNFIGSLLN